MDWLEPAAPHSHDRVVSIFAELGLEPVVYLDLCRSNRALRILCRASMYGEIFRPCTQLAEEIIGNQRLLFCNPSVRFCPILPNTNVDPEWNSEGHDPFHDLAHQLLGFFDFFLWHFK